MPLRATYPTPEHASAAEAIVEFFTANYDVDAVLLATRVRAARRPAIAAWTSWR